MLNLAGLRIHHRLVDGNHLALALEVAQCYLLDALIIERQPGFNDAAAPGDRTLEIIHKVVAAERLLVLYSLYSDSAFIGRPHGCRGQGADAHSGHDGPPG